MVLPAASAALISASRLAIAASQFVLGQTDGSRDVAELVENAGRASIDQRLAGLLEREKIARARSRRSCRGRSCRTGFLYSGSAAAGSCRRPAVGVAGGAAQAASASARPRREAWTAERSFDDFEQLDVEDQRAGGRAGRRVFAVGELGGDPEAAFFALDHELHALGPAGDHAVEREDDRLRRACTELSKSLPSVVQPE